MNTAGHKPRNWLTTGRTRRAVKYSSMRWVSDGLSGFFSMRVIDLIKKEIDNYRRGYVELSPEVKFSQHKLVKRISLFQNRTYSSGKLDSQGDYKYWFDIISPRVDSEIKNIDFDRKDILLESTNKRDDFRLLIANAYLEDWLKETGQGEKLNEVIEANSEWGNALLKKTEDGYELLDFNNVYIINQTAKTINETPVIERHCLTQSYLRSKKGIWKNVDEVLKEVKPMMIKATDEAKETEMETPYYEVYERNGEISEKDLLEAQEKTGGSEDKYVLAKIIVCNLNEQGEEKILYADKLPGKLSDYYKEIHRGRYHGRWFREGLYEILFDVQVRANEIANQIAKGLEWASKVIFRTAEKQTIVSNIKTDLINGDIIHTGDLSQIDMRLHGIDQLIAEWNRLMEIADRLANSYEVVRGESMPSGTPFRLGAILDVNANKLFDFIREKITLTFENLIQDWILPKFLSNLKAQKVIELTGGNLKRYYEMLVDTWYLDNLLVIGPHSQEEAKIIKEAKLAELLKNDREIIKLEKEMWAGFKPRVKVVISGENTRLLTDLETLYSFIQLETDPVRRRSLIELAMRKKGIDVEALPKAEQLPAQTIPQTIPAQ